MQRTTKLKLGLFVILVFALTLFFLEDYWIFKRLGDKVVVDKVVAVTKDTADKAAATIATRSDCCVVSDPGGEKLSPKWFENCAIRLAKVNLQVDPDLETKWHKVSHRNGLLSECQQRWETLLEQRLGCWEFQRYIQIKHSCHSTSFEYVPDVAPLPRILLLGDSVSRGTWEVTQRLFSPLNVATIHAPPQNCGGFALYKEVLNLWLGTCPWDLIQFNVGMHFHGSLEEYVSDLVLVVTKMRLHSPDAHIVFAMTTPSPFDSSDTFPDKDSCVNYNKFHKAGVVPALNQAAQQALKPLNVTINDRYAAVHPGLSEYQAPCDIHYNVEGYNILATSDWQLFTRLLGIQIPISKAENLTAPRKFFGSYLWPRKPFAIKFGKICISSGPRIHSYRNLKK